MNKEKKKGIDISATNSPSSDGISPDNELSDRNLQKKTKKKKKEKEKEKKLVNDGSLYFGQIEKRMLHLSQ